MPVRHFLCILVGDDWQPEHWLQPVSLRGGELASVCGIIRSPANRDRVRYLERSKVDLLSCEACKRAFREQQTKNKRGRRL